MSISVESLAEEFLQWVLDPNDPEGRPIGSKSNFDGPSDRNHNIKNRRIRKFLQHEKQAVGINIGFTDDAEPETARRVRRWFFARKSTETGGVRYGEVIALGCGESPSFLNYDERPAGINLSWSESPSFEWKILGGKLGEAVQTGDRVALFNMKPDETGAPLIYFDRDVGGDLGWPSSKTWRKIIQEKLTDAAWSALKQAAIKKLGG